MSPMVSLLTDSGPAAASPASLTVCRQARYLPLRQGDARVEPRQDQPAQPPGERHDCGGGQRRGDQAAALMIIFLQQILTAAHVTHAAGMLRSRPNPAITVSAGSG